MRPSYKKTVIEMLYNQIQGLQYNSKITIHQNLRDLLKAVVIKNRFNLKHQNKLLIPTLLEAANQMFNNPDITIRAGDKTNIYIISNKTGYTEKKKKKKLKVSSTTKQN